MNVRTLIAIFLGLSVALFAGGCSDSEPVKGTAPVKEVPIWHDNVAAGTVAIRDVGPEDAPQQKAWEFGIGSPCRVSWGIVGSRGSGHVSVTLGAPPFSDPIDENLIPVPAKSLVKLQFSTEEIEGRTVLDNLGVLVGKDSADEVLEAHPELADSTLLRYSTTCDWGAGLASSRGVVPSSVQVASDSSGFRMMSGKRGPRNSQLGTTIYLAHHISYDQSGTGGIKEVDGGCCLEVIDEGGKSQFVPIGEYQLPAWVFWVKFEAVE